MFFNLYLTPSLCFCLGHCHTPMPAQHSLLSYWSKCHTVTSSIIGNKGHPSCPAQLEGQREAFMNGMHRELHRSWDKMACLLSTTGWTLLGTFHVYIHLLLFKEGSQPWKVGGWLVFPIISGIRWYRGGIISWVRSLWSNKHLTLNKPLFFSWLICKMSRESLLSYHTHLLLYKW